MNYLFFSPTIAKQDEMHIGNVFFVCSGESNEGISRPIMQLLKLHLYHINRTRLFADEILEEVYGETLANNGLCLMIVRQANSIAFASLYKKGDADNES